MQATKIEFGDMTIRQISEICQANLGCSRCPLFKLCDTGCDFINIAEADLEYEIDLFKPDPIEEAKKVLIGCGVMTEDGEITEAYKDIIVKKDVNESKT